MVKSTHGIRECLFKCSLLFFGVLLFMLPATSLSAAEAPPTYGFQWGSFGAGNGQFNAPVGIASDSTGNIYVAGIGNNRVQKFSSTGVYISQFGSLGAGNGQFNQPRYIAIDSMDNIYVADTVNSRIQKFDSNGVYITQWPIGFQSVGVAVGPSDNIFVTEGGSGTPPFRVAKFTSSGSLIQAWNTLPRPQGIAVDSACNVYVATLNNVIQKFNCNGVFQMQWGSAGTGDGQFNESTGIAVDASGNVFVADRLNHRVQKFTGSGVFLSKWGSLGTGNGQFNQTLNVSLDAAGSIYVADVLNHRIQKFRPVPGVPFWSTKAPYPDAGLFNASAQAIGSKIYVVGGSDIVTGLSTDRLEIYDSVTDTWMTGAPMPTKRLALVTGVIGGKLYVAGGFSNNVGVIQFNKNILEIYDPATNTWSTGAPMPGLRSSAMGGVIGNKLYVAGGASGCCPSTAHADLFVYDPVTNSWASKASMAAGPRFSGAAGVVNGKLYVAGGETWPSSPSVTLFEEYDPVTNIWTTKASMPSVNHNFTTGVVNNKFYVIGGRFSPFGDVQRGSVWVYDSLVDSWSVDPNVMPTPRSVSAFTVLNNALHVIGGQRTPPLPPTNIHEVFGFSSAAANQPPTLVATGNSPTFVEGAGLSQGVAVTLFSGAVSDPVEPGQSLDQLTLTLSNVGSGLGEQLSLDGGATFIDLTAGTGKAAGTIGGSPISADILLAGGTATVLVNIPAPGLSSANMSMLINGMKYRSTSNNPTANGTILRVATITALRDSGSPTPPNSNINTSLAISSTVTIVGVNDAPVAVNDSTSIAEDSVLTLVGPGILVNDSDPEGDPLTAIQVVGTAHGPLTLNPDGSLTYTPNPNFNGLDSFTYKANDGALNSNIATVIINVAPVNDAPVSTGFGVALASILEDTASPAGEAIFALVGNISDVDVGANKGIAIHQIDTANGTWQYSMNGGTTWTPIGVVSTTNALMLSANVFTRVRFVPSPNYNGTATFQFFAWDQTSGVSGGTANAAIRGGTTAFSSSSDTATITVLPVNDAPTLNAIATNPVFTEGSIAVSLFSFASVSTIESAQTLDLLRLTLTNVVDGMNEVLTIDGSTIVLTNGNSVTTVANGMTVSVALAGNLATVSINKPGGIPSLPMAALVNQITYQNSSQNPTAASLTATLTSIRDSGGTVNGGVDTALLSISSSVTVVPVNDAPVIASPASTIALQTIIEDPILASNSGVTVASLIAGSSISDPDGASASKGIAVEATDTTFGLWEYSLDGGAIWKDMQKDAAQTAPSVITEFNALLLSGAPTTRIRFNPNVNGNGFTSISFYAWDRTSHFEEGRVNLSPGGVPKGGTSAFSATVQSAQITVTPVQDAPVLFVTAPTLVGGYSGLPTTGTTVATIVNGNIADPDLPLALKSIAVTGTSLGGVTGDFEYSMDGGATWTAFGLVSVTQSLLLNSSSLIRFNSTVGVGTPSFTFRAWDQTTGVTASKVNTSLNGGTSAFSVAADTASVIILISAVPSVTAITNDTGISSDFITNDSTLTVSGVLSMPLAPNQVVQVSNDAGATWVNASTQPSAGTTWNHVDPSVHANGVFTYQARVFDSISATQLSISGLQNVFIDSIAPASPAMPDLAAVSDTGLSTTDNITSDATPIFQGAPGSAEANAVVEVFDGVVSIGTTIANVTGAWSVTASLLSNGMHSISARQTDAAGNVSPSSPGLNILIDSIAVMPDAPDLVAAFDTGISTVDNITNSVTPTFRVNFNVGNFVGDTIELLLNGMPFSIPIVHTLIATDVTSGFVDMTVSPGNIAPDGVHSITARAIDLAGNVSVQSPALSIVVDTVAPPMPTVAVLTTTNTTPIITGTLVAFDHAGGFTVSVNGSAYTLGVDAALTSSGNIWSLNLAVAGQILPAGTYNVLAAAIDAAGNASADATSSEITIGAASVPALPLAGGATASITVPAGSTITNASSGPAIGGPAGVIFPFGTIAYSVTSPVGGSVTTVISFSTPVPVPLLLWKFDGLTYTPIPPSLWAVTGPNTVSITLTDGGPFDLDGVANGIIVDPIAIGADVAAPLFTAPVPIVVTATGVQTAVALTPPVVTDLSAVTITNNAPLTFPLGLTTVVWTATDASGNVATATQTVTVNAPNVALLTPAQIVLLTPAQLALLSPAQIAGLTPLQLAAMAPAQLAALMPIQIAALTPAQVAALNPMQLGILLPLLTPVQIVALTPTQLAALTPIQVAVVIGGLTPAQAGLLTPAQLAAVTAAQIAALSPPVAAIVNALLGGVNEEVERDDDDDDGHHDGKADKKDKEHDKDKDD